MAMILKLLKNERTKYIYERSEFRFIRLLMFKITNNHSYLDKTTSDLN